jgi:hypothetical protein
MFALSLRFPSSQILAHNTVCAKPHIPPPRKYLQLQVFALSLILSSSQILAITSVCAQPQIPLLRYLQIPLFALSLIFLLSDYLQLPLFTLSLIFSSSHILATTSVPSQPQFPSQTVANASLRAQPRIYLLSDTCNCKCLCSASYSPPLRYLHIQVFALNLIFPSVQILSATNVLDQPHIHLLSDTCRCQCLRSASYSSSLRVLQIQVLALSLIFLPHTCKY